jgi:cell division cycle protein 37
LNQQEEFTAKNEKLMKKFGLMQRYDDSQQHLSDHPHLVCEETANYLVIWCINLEFEQVGPS